MSEAAAERMRTPPGPAPQLTPEQLREGIEAAKKWLLDQYESRLDEAQLARLRDSKSEREINEMFVQIQLLGRPVEFEVVESFVGEISRSVEVFTGRGGGDCGFDFKEGETYLIEANRRANGEWHSWLCQSRVSGIESAAEDLRTLRAWKRGKPLGPRIYGVASDWTQRQDNHSRRRPPAAGVELALSTDDHPIRAVADHDGRFQFEDLKPAVYSLSLEKPGWDLIRVSDGQKPIDLTGLGCAELSVLIAEQQGKIAGRVVPQPGEKLPDHLWIEAISKEPEAAEPFDGNARSRDGEFEIDEIEPGDYLVAINVKNSPSGPHHPSARQGRIWPYGPTYFPGVSDPIQATVFHVERGQTINLKDWMLPPRLTERRVAGVALLPSGVPAADVRILLRRPALKEAAERSGPTGGDGQFVVWPLESLEFLLEAASYDPDAEIVYRGELKISADENGPLTLHLEATDEKPTDRVFFDEYAWRKR